MPNTMHTTAPTYNTATLAPTLPPETPSTSPSTSSSSSSSTSYTIKIPPQFWSHPERKLGITLDKELLVKDVSTNSHTALYHPNIKPKMARLEGFEDNADAKETIRKAK